jgi:DNA-binding transcriptional LysR family regulator
LFKSDVFDAVIHTASSVASLINLAEQGVGLALLPLPLVNAKLNQGTLTQINTEIEPPALEFCCNWRSDEESIMPKLMAHSARETMQLSSADLGLT